VAAPAAPGRGLVASEEVADLRAVAKVFLHDDIEFDLPRQQRPAELDLEGDLDVQLCCSSAKGTAMEDVEGPDAARATRRRKLEINTESQGGEPAVSNVNTARARTSNQHLDTESSKSGTASAPVTPRGTKLLLEKRTSALAEARNRHKERLSAEDRSKRFSNTIRQRLDEVIRGLKVC
jgi:hypothetical protein